jgi:hypothetical protein
VKTELSKQQVDIALQNEAALRELKFQPLLVPYWQTRTNKDRIPHAPPVHCVFGYRSSTEDFGTFCGWFSGLPTQCKGDEGFPYHPSFNHFIACALDKGLIFCRGDGHVPHWLPIAEGPNSERSWPVIGDGHQLRVDPAKTLFMFLETLWTMIEQSPRHPGFDIRSYMDDELQTFIPFTYDGKIEHPR